MIPILHFTATSLENNRTILSLDLHSTKGPFEKMHLPNVILLPLLAVTTVTMFCTSPERNIVEIDTPEKLYGDLFYDVQANPEIFSDSKTFPDCLPNVAPKEIRKRYDHLEDRSTSSLKKFISENFSLPQNATPFGADSLPIDQHIVRLWNYLERSADKPVSGTRIPLPNPYIVPGGRFREIYYWDSYFTMLGLREDSLVTAIGQMVDNFAYLIDTCGFIPNGNRTYYRTRSQPPFFAMMVAVLASCKGDNIFITYRSQLEKEHRFWMNGIDTISKTAPAFKRVVLMDDSTVLNRYWDDAATPRAESYREDMKTTAVAVEKNPSTKMAAVYRNLRAAAESGWDFSSRWLTPDSSGTFYLHTIHTTEIIPVDLNVLLCNLERTISRAYALSGDSAAANHYQALADKRRGALNRYCWNDSTGWYMDYRFTTGEQTGVFSLAGIYPLFFRLASTDQAHKAAGTIRNRFLKPGGVVTTLYPTGQQWDMPNGWAPLQWLTIKGLRNYGHTGLADTVSSRWCSLNRKVYRTTYKMMEKYNVLDTTREGGGGEYPTQDGFGWTNGVYEILTKH
jgi:alpha,alpha-trehalase